MQHFYHRFGRFGILAMLAALVAAGPAAIGQPSSGITTYRNEKFGFSLAFPSEAFIPGEARNPADGGLWISRDGQARLIAVAGRNETNETVQSYRAFMLSEPYKGATIDYAPMRENWFVLSGTMGGRMFYERINFVCDGRFIYGWQLMYPAGERRYYDRIIEFIHRSYRIGRGSGGECGGPAQDN